MRRVARWLVLAASTFALAACTPGGPPPTLTDLYVDPIAGSDAASGTTAAPLRTLSAALQRADAGVTIHLAAGTYDAANGETWPTQVGFPPVATPNVPDGVAIEGTAGVRLVGPGGATTAAALVFAGGATVHDVEMEGFERAMLAWLPGPVALTRVRAAGNTIDGLLAFGEAEVLAVLSRFDANGLSGAAAFGDAVLDLQGGMADGNRTGVFAAQAAMVSVLDMEIGSNGTDGSEAHSGVYARDAARVVLSGALLEWNSLAGVEVRGDASVVLTDTTVTGGQYGLYVTAATAGASLHVFESDVSSNGAGIRWGDSVGGALLVRDTTVRFSFGHGVAIVGDPAVVDLGVSGETSGNRFEGNGLYQLLDGRPDRPAADGPVIAVDVGAVIPEGCIMVVGVITGPHASVCGAVPIFAIEGMNQRVSVVLP
jgi:hypothetical protein